MGLWETLAGSAVCPPARPRPETGPLAPPLMGGAYGPAFLPDLRAQSVTARAGPLPSQAPDPKPPALGERPRASCRASQSGSPCGGSMGARGWALGLLLLLLCPVQVSGPGAPGGRWVCVGARAGSGAGAGGRGRRGKVVYGCSRGGPRPPAPVSRHTLLAGSTAGG